MYIITYMYTVLYTNVIMRTVTCHYTSFCMNGNVTNCRSLFQIYFLTIR